MTDKYKGIVETEGIGFKYGSLTFINLAKMEGTTLDGLIPKIREENLETIINFLYCGAVQYARLYKQPEPSIDEIAHWYDGLDIEKRVDVLKAIVETAFAVPKKDPNPVAP